MLLLQVDDGGEKLVHGGNESGRSLKGPLIPRQVRHLLVQGNTTGRVAPLQEQLFHDLLIFQLVIYRGDSQSKSSRIAGIRFTKCAITKGRLTLLR